MVMMVRKLLAVLYHRTCDDSLDRNQLSNPPNGNEMWLLYLGMQSFTVGEMKVTVHDKLSPTETHKEPFLNYLMALSQFRPV